MLFDWFTFIAQFINFIILVLLLKRFLFKPILNAIDERENKIAAKIQDAENLKKEATTELNDYTKKNAELSAQRQELLDNSIKEAEAERNKQLEQLHADIEGLRKKFDEAIRNEQKSLSAEIKQRAREEIFVIVRKVLADLASSNLENQMTGVFIDRLNRLDKAEKEQMLSEVRRAKGGLTIRTTYKLAQEQQKILTDILNNSHFGKLQLRFETTPELVSGIELVAGGYKLVWSIEDYLQSLEENLAETVSSKI